MLFSNRKSKEAKENEIRIRRTHGREVRYVTKRDGESYTEIIIGKYGVIDIQDDIFTIVCSDKIIFSHSVKGLLGSELMSLDGIILSYQHNTTKEFIEVIAYYKYHRK